MFKFEEICELIQLVGSSGVSSVEVEHAGSRVRIDGRAQAEAAPAAPPTAAESAPQPTAPPVPDAPPAPTAAAPEAEAAPAEEDNLHSISSPIVGTFYRAPNPDADPYVKVGDFVEPGQTLCIVEAMKLMNEIESDVSGTVVRVLSENAQPVEYGENLFLVRPA
jgi:acetyl-CoA carboxylase biotin carboxyl carrier protein